MLTAGGQHPFAHHPGFPFLPPVPVREGQNMFGQNALADRDVVGINGVFPALGLFLSLTSGCGPL